MEEGPGLRGYKYAVTLTLFIAFTISITACAKKEPPPSPPQQQPMMQGHTDIQMPSSEEMKVIVPDNIRERWKGVILTVVDRQTMDMRDYNVPAGGRVMISNSNIEIQTKEFLPDLKIDGNIYTTASTELLNPAIHVIIKEDGKELFKGWLFQKFPSVHPFKHQKFSITLKEPVGG